MNQSVSVLGNVVCATRKSKNLSQEHLAEKLGVEKLAEIREGLGRNNIDVQKILEKLDITI